MNATHHRPEPDDPIPIDHAAERRSLADTFLRKFFEAAIKYEASDLLLRGGQTPKLRIRGGLQSLKTDRIDTKAFEEAVEAGISDAQWAYYSEHGSLDIGVDVMQGDRPTRFRVNLFRARGQSAIAARRVSNDILDFKGLYLPPVMETISQLEHGLVLLAGITGSGKSTTIASMLNHINQNRSCHIVTLEDPIEYLFTEDKAMIHQREIGLDVPNFAVGLKALVRENPDVVLIGEMRDKETFEAALQAAETGHLVFGTIHASSATQAFGRIYDLFPANEREAIRNMLAYQIQAVVYQKLMPTLREDLHRVPAVEVLLQSPPTRKYILEGREHELGDVVKTQSQMGMQTFTDSLVSLVERELIHPRVAQQTAHNPDEVKMRLKGIVTN